MRSYSFVLFLDNAPIHYTNVDILAVDHLKRRMFRSKGADNKFANMLSFEEIKTSIPREHGG